MYRMNDFDSSGPALPGSAPTVALVVGHEPTKPGACTPGQGVEGCEYFENKPFVEAIRDYLEQRGHVIPVVVFRTQGYSKLPGMVNALDPDFVISFHSNAYNRVASGTETLYASCSANGKRLANLLQRCVVRTLNLPDRGIKAREKSERGGLLLWGVKAPCVILEPFFNDNVRDDAVFHAKKDELVVAIGAAIESFARSF